MVLKISETGEVVTFETEEQFYHYFGLPFIPPELREDGTEVEQYDDSEPIIVHLMIFKVICICIRHGAMVRIRLKK